MNNPITNNDNIISFLTNRTYDICCASMSLILYTPNYFGRHFPHQLFILPVMYARYTFSTLHLTAYTSQFKYMCK